MRNDVVYLRNTLTITAGDAGKSTENVILPDGEVESSKGTFLIDADAWEQLKAAFALRGEIVIDWEHQTMGGEFQRPDGKSPAAGWIKSLRYEEGVGVIATCEWNEEARELIRSKQYKFWSPAIRMDKKTKQAVELVSAGLTNTPAIYDMPALAASDRTQEDDMVKTLKVKPEDDLRSILVAFQDEELPQFPAISADQQMVTRLLDLLNEKGAGLEDGATLADVLAKAIEMLGAEDADEGGEGEDEGMSAEDAAELRAALELDEKGDIMATVKAMKETAAALTLKAGSAENAEARLKELETAEAKRVEEAHKALIQKAVDANRLNPNDKPQMEAAALILKAQGVEAFTALVGGLVPYAVPDQLVKPGAMDTNIARTKLITENAKEWEADRSRGSARCSTYVNVALKDEGHSALTTAEVAKLDGKENE